MKNNRKNCFVTIKRGEAIDGFRGEIVAETSSHYKVVHVGNREGEWFAIRSPLVNVYRSRVAAERVHTTLAAKLAINEKLK